MERETERSVDLAPIDALIQHLNDEDPSLLVLFSGQQVLDELAMLKAVVMDRPQEMVEDGRLKEIESLASNIASIISSSSYLKDMDQDNALQLYTRRIVTKTQKLYSLIPTLKPKLSLITRLRTETKRKMDLAHLESLFEHLHKGDESLVMSPLRKLVSRELAFLHAVLSDPRQNLVEDDEFKKAESMASTAGFIISAFELKNMDQNMALHLCNLLRTRLTPMSPYMQNARWRLRGSQVYPIKIGQLRFVDHLVENLAHLLTAKVDSIGPLKFYILRLQRKLQSVSCHLKGIPESRKEDADVKDLMTSITRFASEVEYAIDSFLVRSISMFQCVFYLEDILEEFKRFRRQVKIESGDTQSIVRSIITCVGKGLIIIPIVRKSQISEFQLRQVFNHHNIVHTFSVRTWSLVSSFKERKKEFFLQLLNNVAYHGTYLGSDKEILWQPSYGPNVPHGDKIAYAYRSYTSEDELKSYVVELLNRGPYFIILEDVPDIYVFYDIIKVLPKNMDGSRVLLITRSSELAIRCRYYSRKDFLSKVSTDHTSKSQTNKRISDDNVVGFKVETEGMFDRLTRGPSKLHIISIVGMPGQGKTTLAKKLYNDVVVVNYFHTRAWCYVSQVYQKRELLLELLHQVGQLFDTIHLKNDEELAEMLYKYLKGRRFFIVMDDMWKIDAWNDLSRCFPNDNNGSRIVFTTRIQKLTSQCKSDSILQFVYPLSDNESWELLKKVVFPKDSCPSELLEVGELIAKKCKGLPLAVVLVAGCLKQIEKKGYWWEQIAENLTSSILGGGETLGKDVIELSYNHLSDHLKLCFLYCGAFLEDREILVSRLIRLWIAEGFIRHTKLKSLEDIAEDYLMDLIGGSLITIAQETSRGGIKTCRIHDLLHEFCLNKAKEENLLQLIDGSKSSLNFMVKLYIGLDSPAIINSSLNLLPIHFRRNYFIMLKSNGALLRSLLFFPAKDMWPSYLYDMPFMFRGLKFLKILDLGDIKIENPFKVIDVLVLLKYLAVQGKMDLIPSSIANLWSLETFFVKGSSAKVVKVSDSIWDMKKLRHLHINDHASFDFESHRLENSSILDNLQTFSTPSLAYGDDMEGILRRLPGIQKLKCIFLDSWDDAMNCNQFPELGFLNQLLSLKVFYNGEGKFPCQFNIPSNLKKLTLSNFHMPWNEISQLATLHNLEALKLLVNAFEGETWEMEDEVFAKLKFLKLEGLNIVKWSALPDNFPHLQRLLVHKCEQLEEIPSDIGDIPTLQVIEVMWCSLSAAMSAKQIQEDQLDFGNDGLKIQIQPKILDLISSSEVNG